MVGALVFCWFLPQQKHQCKEWAEDIEQPANASLERVAMLRVPISVAIKPG